MNATLSQRYPARYWTALLFLVGVPNFLYFDPTGRTHDYGLFNLTSVVDIALTLIATGVIVCLTVVGKRRLMARKLQYAWWFWNLFFGNMLVSSILEPTPHVVDTGSGGIALCLFRLWQWVLALILLLSLYSRASNNEAPQMMSQLIARICWINIAIVWIVLPIAPSLAYVSEDASASSAPRLGGVMIHPGVVGLLASTAFFHGILLLRHRRRVAACTFALLTLALTYTRSSQIMFLIVLLVYLIFVASKPALRWCGIVTLVAILLVAAGFHNAVSAYLSRGQSASDVASLSDRTEIWNVALKAAEMRPYIGYGFIVGARDALRDNWDEDNWLPPHAHNELVQALLSGGALAVFLVAWLYLYILWIGFRNARRDSYRTFFLLIWIELTIETAVSTNITTAFSRMGALLLISFVALFSDRLTHPEDNFTAEHVESLSALETA